MSDENLVNKLGRCWAFPPQFTPDRVIMAEGIEDILQSLRVLFITEPGERIMRETWGAGMNDFLFENISDELLARIENHIEESLLRYEPRVVLQDVIIRPAKDEASRLLIQISVRLSGSDISEMLEGTLDLNKAQTLRLL